MNVLNSVWPRLSWFGSRLLPVALFVALVPAAAPAQGARVGGHVGLATPLVTVTESDDADTDISETFVLVAPLGVTVKVSDRFAVDFEMQVANQVDPTPRGNANLVVAPGAIYNAGPFALGLRVASAIGAPANVGVIPLVNRGLFPVGTGTWFVEAAFPFFMRSDPAPDWTFDVVFHTGVAF